MVLRGDDDDPVGVRRRGSGHGEGAAGAERAGFAFRAQMAPVL